jgi:hypothetical protein
MTYTYTTQAQVRAAFWQGWPEGFQRGKRHNEYNATTRLSAVSLSSSLTCSPAMVISAKPWRNG